MQDDTRRSFLKYVIAGSATVAAVAAGKKQVAARGAEKTEKYDTLYKESEDFKRYYDSLRS